MEITTAVLVIVFVYILSLMIKWAFKRHQRLKLFVKYGIPGPKPDFLGGNMYQIRRQPPNEAITKWLKEYGNVFGYFIGGEPYLVVNDLEMLKQVMIKDFHAFGNRPEMFIDTKPLNKTLLALKDQRWKEVRGFITPTFSSGKIKLMTQIVDKKVDVTIAEVSKKAENNEMFDIYELIQGLTLDVIADCALAMKTHCQENPKDQFLIAVRDFFRYSQNEAVDLAIMFPFVAKIMGFIADHMTAGQMTSLIVDNVMSVIKSRKQNPNVKSIDLLQLMLDHRKNDDDESVAGMTDEEIVANAYVFLLAGYETTATALAFTFYLLITHPEIQERLQQEIDAAEDSSYSTVQNLQYLDQVFTESLRIYPPVTGFVSRLCDEDHGIGKYTVPKGTVVIAPVWDIHHNPEYYPDPWKFDPDRFSPERKGSVNTMAFLPFGAGRRNCIGARFAQLEAKLALFRLLKEFTLEKCEKTDDPLTLICPTVIINPVNGIWLRAVPRLKDGIYKHNSVGYSELRLHHLAAMAFEKIQNASLAKVMIDDFQTFHSRPYMFKDMKPMNKTLIGLKYERWNEVTIAVDLIIEKYENNEIFDIHDLFERLTLGIIADCAFTMKSRCQVHPGDNLLLRVREFMRNSHSRLTEFGIMFPIIASLRSFITNHITEHSRMNTTILENLSAMIIARRTNRNLRSLELVQLMVNESDKDRGSSTKLTEEEVIANCYMITLMAYETTSAALTYIFYLLIKHPDIQDRLCKEIDAAPDEFTFQELQSFPYLDQVYKESLRLYPPVTGFVSRICQKDHKVGSFVFPKGAAVQIPVWNLHHDPELWPDPCKFDPERFSPSKRGSIKPMSYMPFGEGPRNCIGMYYAELQVKLTVFRLFETFRFEPCEKTEDPISLVTHTLYTNPANGLWVRAIRRKFPKLIG
nr:cytochrome P450 3A2 [Parasteatoda tepidariorum]